MDSFYIKHKRIIHTMLLIVGFILLIYIFVNYLFSYFAPFVLGFILSLILNPLANLLVKKFKMWRGVAAIICILLFIGVIGSIGTGIVVRIFNEAHSFLMYMYLYINNLAAQLAELELALNDILSFIPEGLHDVISSVLPSMLSFITQALGSGVKTGTGNLVSVIPGFLMATLLTFISGFFFIKDKELIGNTVKNLLPQWLTKQYMLIKQGLFTALGGYFKAQLILMSITAVICITGLMILRYPYALFIGLVIALIDALPIFGSGFILWPWAASSFITKDYTFGISLLVIYGVVMLTRQMLEPRILGKQIGVHPLLTLMSIYIGLKIFGVFGFFIGPVTVVVVKVLYKANQDVKIQNFIAPDK